MKSITKLVMSLMLLFSMSFAFAQQTTENVTEKLYQDYKKNGIDKTLKNYDKNPVKGNEYTFLSEPLNVLGYRLMSEGDLEAAEKVFLAQIDEYPNEANPYDSYADLLMEKGDEAKAKKNYKKAIDLSATMEDLEEKAQMLEASKTKLAKLEGAGTELQFLEGKWSNKNYGFENGEKFLRNEGNVVFTTNEDKTVLTGTLHSKSGDYIGTRILTYDAVDEEYDMVWIGNSLTGIEPSTMKIEKSTPTEIVMIEKYEENGEKRKVKHILNRKSGEIAWDIHDLTNSEAKNPVAHMEFKKQN
ncbi:hypothetical protein NE848_01930 [Gramella jeungdoensis]|uniref:Tetratricopeptide repeat protein n=1 Tax=Gramella jeungdoensis TaxID=708091 RepID=A0ABT0YXD0_9FLAO|nr:hypothetical protein [Gramella jeungdoensis]MCM8568116.1 hypothetical protein [Gramella jeungdoensis]